MTLSQLNFKLMPNLPIFMKIKIDLRRNLLILRSNLNRKKSKFKIWQNSRKSNNKQNSKMKQKIYGQKKEDKKDLGIQK